MGKVINNNQEQMWTACKIDNRKRLTNIDAIEQVVMLAKGSVLCSEFFCAAKRPLKYLSKHLSLTAEQAALFSIFVNFSNNHRIEISEVVDFVGCTQIEMLRRASDIARLRKLGYIKRASRNQNNEAYIVTSQALKAVMEDGAFEGLKITNLSIDELFEVLKLYFNELDRGICTHDEFEENIEELLSSNEHLMFVSKFASYPLDRESQLLLLQGCNMYVNLSDTTIMIDDITPLYEFQYIARDIMTKLNNNDHPLLTYGLLQHYGNDLKSADAYELGRTAIEDLLAELKLSVGKRQSRQDVIAHSDICAKTLYYNANEQRQISQLENLLQPERFKTVCDRLEAKGLRRGLTALFYGAPGTGKTETVLQIARNTGRDLIVVDVSELRNMYVGESEKSVKRLFDHYKALVNESDIAPILLFNEADAIIGKRTENVSHAVDKMENAMQNIILQEMEGLEGILIATTNLTQNMDRAFERRFLYKIEFCAPELETRCSIWQSMLPMLNELDALNLANTYNFSGGQIENIARKCTVEQILGESEVLSLETISTFCNEEQLHKESTRRKIGF